MPLSDTALVILNAAAQRDDRRAELPEKLPAAARNAVARSLFKQGLLEEGTGEVLRITDAGFRALNLAPPQPATTPPEPHSGPQESAATEADTNTAGSGTALRGPHEAAVAMPRQTLRQIAQMVAEAWSDREVHPDALTAAIEQLGALVAAKPARSPREPNTPRKPREGTKQQTVLDLLRRDEGTNIAQIVAATAWAQHTVRGFLANLKRKGITVVVLERVRQGGPGSAGAKGSYSIYRIASAA